MVKVIQCDNCNPPCTFPHQEGWIIPERCAFGDCPVTCDYEIKEIEIEEIIKIFN